MGLFDDIAVSVIQDPKLMLATILNTLKKIGKTLEINNELLAHKNQFNETFCELLAKHIGAITQLLDNIDLKLTHLIKEK